LTPTPTSIKKKAMPAVFGCIRNYEIMNEACVRFFIRGNIRRFDSVPMSYE